MLTLIYGWPLFFVINNVSNAMFNSNQKSSSYNAPEIKYSTTVLSIKAIKLHIAYTYKYIETQYVFRYTIHTRCNVNQMHMYADHPIIVRVNLGVANRRYGDQQNKTTPVGWSAGGTQSLMHCASTSEPRTKDRESGNANLYIFDHSWFTKWQAVCPNKCGSRASAMSGAFARYCVSVLRIIEGKCRGLASRDRLIILANGVQSILYV